MLKLGDKSIKSLYLGEKSIKSLYLGDILVYKKKNYTELEYLESTGTQYIDTGIKLTNNHSVYLDYQLTQQKQTRTGLFGGVVTGGDNAARFGSLLSPSNSYLEHGYGAGNVYWQQGMPDTNRHVIYQRKNELYFDNVLVHTFENATFNLPNNAPLGNFDFTNYKPALARYYACKLWNGDVLVRNFIPVLDKDNVPCMYDKVSGEFFYNQGSGEFLYG